MKKVTIIYIFSNNKNFVIIIILSIIKKNSITFLYFHIVIYFLTQVYLF